MAIKRMINIILRLLVITLISLTVDVTAEKNISVGDVFNVEGISSGNNTYIIDFKFSDVTGDEIGDQVLLIGDKISGKDDIFSDNLTIVVRNGSTGNYTKASYEKFSGYEGELFIGDFNGDNVKDVMVTTAHGGSGAIYEHLIAIFKDNQPKVIFSDKENLGIEINGKYKDGFQAEIEVNNIVDFKKQITIDLSNNKDEYINTNIYSQDGKLLTEVIPCNYPFSTLKPVDFDYDGIYELWGEQRLVGSCNADTIAFVRSIWEFQESGWRVKEFFFYKLLDYTNVPQLFNQTKAAIEDSNSLNYDLVKKLLEIKDKKIRIYYPQLANYPGELSMDYMNQSLETILTIYAGELYTDVKIDYEITKMDENILSVLFKGIAKMGEKNIKIQQSINLDLNSTNEITFENLINDPDKSKVLEILNKKVIEKGIKEGLEAEGMSIYFKDEDIVFYYMPLDDSAEEFIEVTVSKDGISNYLNNYFGEIPVS